MTNAQVSGNLMYAAALQQLTRLAAAKNMTDQEIERIKKTWNAGCDPPSSHYAESRNCFLNIINDSVAICREVW